MLTISQWMPLGFAVAFLIVSILLIVVYWARKYTKMTTIPYDSPEMETIIWRLFNGETVHLLGIKDYNMFMAFVVEAEFHRGGISQRLIHYEPDEDMGYFLVKLIDEGFVKTQL